MERFTKSTFFTGHGAHSPMSSSGTLFERCAVDTDNGDQSLMLQCVANGLEQQSAFKSADLDEWLLVLAGALVFFMQAGFAMLCAGCVRKKNVMNTMLKNVLDACCGCLAFYCVGYAFAFGANESTEVTLIGSSNFFLLGHVDQAFWFYQFAFSANAVTIVAGTLAERCQMAAYLCYSIVLTGFVYPVVVHAIWSSNGMLSAFAADPYRGIGVIDFAGSGVVHTTGGTTALIATYILGARKGRFHDSRGRLLEKPRDIPGHSIALQIMGTMVLWFGWYGFNPGSAILLTNSVNRGRVASLAAVNTSLSAATGAITALFVNLYLQERRTGEYSYDLNKVMNGCLSGLVAVTAGCGTVENWAGVAIGAVAGLVYLGGSNLLIRLKLDDAVDAIPVHLFNGMWGVVASGLFSSPKRTLDAYGTDEYVGWFYEIGRGSLDATLLSNQLLSLVFIVGWVIFTMMPFFLLLNYLGWFRSDSLEELVGLDLAYMGNNVSSMDRQSQNSGGDDFSQGLPDDATDFGDASIKRNTRSFTNMSDRDEGSVAKGAAPEQSQKGTRTRI